MQSSTNYRVGSTVDPERRRKEYVREGYTGEMQYAKTTDMRRAEDRLLSTCKGNNSCPANVQRQSNQKHKEGYVYTIKK